MSESRREGQNPAYRLRVQALDVVIENSVGAVRIGRVYRRKSGRWNAKVGKGGLRYLMTPVRGSDGEVEDLTFATYEDREAAAAAVGEAWAGAGSLTEPDPVLS